MVRRLNLSHLTREECQKIVDVIHRDFELRTRERERLKKLEEEEKKKRVGSLHKGEKGCTLCHATFNLLFNKRLVCGQCEAPVCRNCSLYHVESEMCLCRFCDQQRNLRAQSCEWFYDKVKMRFSLFGSTKVLLSMYGLKKAEGANEPEQEATDVQQHMELVLEGFLGESLDSACVGRMFNHLSYDQVVLDYRVPLREAVLQFSSSLLGAMQDKPKEANVSPTTAHAHLKEWVQRLRRDAEGLPNLQDVCEKGGSRRNSSSAFSDMSDECDDISLDTYEDLLVMALINKAVEIGQRKYERWKESRKWCQPDVLQTSKKEQIDVGCQSDIPFSDSGQDEEGFTETTESDEFFWARPSKEDDFPYIIEEKIEEEITEAYSESEEEPSQPEEPDGNILLALDWSHENRVPFPEMGVDLVDPGTYLDEGPKDVGEVDPAVLVSSVVDWEENWLFRRKQRNAALAAFRGGRYARYFDPIHMLIPNPSQQECVLLGSREVDECSEMSEKFSVGSLEFPSSSESDEEVTPFDDISVRDEGSSLQGSEKWVVPDRSSLVKHPVACLGVCATAPPMPLARVRTRPEATSTPRLASASTQSGMLHASTISKYRPKEERENASSLSFLCRPDAKTVIHAGKTARFLCKVASPKVLGVSWFRGTELLTSTEKCRLYQTRGKEFCLEVYNVSKADEGTFSAVAYTEKEELWCDFSVAVRATARAYNKPEFTIAPHVAEWTGQDLHISCTVSGYPEPRVSFFHDQQLLPEDGAKFVLENEGYGQWSLKVQNPTEHDEGQYSAVASNSLGQAVETLTFNLGDLNVKSTHKCSVKEHRPRKPNESGVVRPLTAAAVSRKSGEKPLVVQQTWADRQAQLLAIATAHKWTERAQKESQNGTCAFEKENASPAWLCKDPCISDDTEPSLEIFNCPPKPGTIAEREHAKWLNAVPLENNPYSAENLARRASLVRKDSVLSSTTHEEDENPFYSPVLPASYIRDYYINNPKLLATAATSRGHAANKGDTQSDTDCCQERLHSFDEQLYSSPRKAFSPTLQLQQVKSLLAETPPAGITQATVGKFESSPEVMGRKCGIQEDLSLPSVRELVLKFASPSTQSSIDISAESPVTELRSSEKEGEQLKYDARKDGEAKKPQPLPRKNLPASIHSLTARSLSREFREHAQKNLVPRQMNRTSQTPPQSTCVDLPSWSEQQKSGDTTPGYASDESSNSSGGAPAARVIAAKRRRNLPQRTSYWDRRAERGLLSDSSVTDANRDEEDSRLEQV